MGIKELKALAQKDSGLAAGWKNLARAALQYRPLWHEKGIAASRGRKLSGQKQSQLSAARSAFEQSGEAFTDLCLQKGLISRKIGLNVSAVADLCDSAH